mmetsp:Transcript_27435/g.87925  ORF Transcript_27435/g.87925 Transcript_27435/m.87925 type:complete len:241 (-) Transcript_27435:469-1191(-)
MDVKVIEGISSRAAHTPYSHPSIMFASTQVMSAKSSATFGNAKALKAVKAKAVTPVSRGTVAMASADGMVPDMAKRTTMNLLLLGAVGAPALGVLGPYAYLFVPKSAGGGGGGIAAKDALGNDIKQKEWLATHPKGDRNLTQGLKGDATYLIVNDDGTLANFGVNAVCTHLGCVVPWNAAENKFMCPCHGSQYNFQGKVVRGPAPLSLALAHADIAADDTVVFSTWTETDFRTGLEPWWK